MNIPSVAVCTQSQDRDFKVSDVDPMLTEGEVSHMDEKTCKGYTNAVQHKTLYLYCTNLLGTMQISKI